MSEFLPKIEKQGSPPAETVSELGGRALRPDGFEIPEARVEQIAVRMGDTVVIEIDGDEETVIVLPSEQAKQNSDAVSETSPIGKALQGSVVTSVVKWRTPNGTLVEATVKDIIQ